MITIRKVILRFIIHISVTLIVTLILMSLVIFGQNIQPFSTLYEFLGHDIYYLIALELPLISGIVLSLYFLYVNWKNYKDVSKFLGYKPIIKTSIKREIQYYFKKYYDRDIIKINNEVVKKSFIFKELPKLGVYNFSVTIYFKDGTKHTEEIVKTIDKVAAYEFRLYLSKINGQKKCSLKLVEIT